MADTTKPTEGQLVKAAPDGTGSADDDAPARDASQSVANMIAPALMDLPQPKREQLIHTIKESIHTAFIATGFANAPAAPKMDAESIRVLTESANRESENKFKYFSQRQADTAEEQKRQHEREMTRQSDTMKIVRPCVYASIALVLALVSSGLYFIAIDKEAVGSSIISGTLGAFFGFLGGLGVSKLSKE